MIVTWQEMFSGSTDTRNSISRWIWFRRGLYPEEWYCYYFGSILVAGNTFPWWSLVGANIWSLRVYLLTDKCYLSCGHQSEVILFERNHDLLNLKSLLFPTAYKAILKTIPKEEISEPFWAVAALRAWTFELPEGWFRCNIFGHRDTRACTVILTKGPRKWTGYLPRTFLTLRFLVSALNLISWRKCGKCQR